MKAWCVHDGWPEEGVLLVYADTRNKARWLGVTQHPLLGDFRYEDMIAKRANKWDDLFADEQVICDNSELPEGAPEFWGDDEDEP